MGGVHEGAGAGGAGHRDGHRRTAQPERGANETRQGEDVMGVDIVEAGGKRAGGGVAMLKRLLAGEDAGGAGPDHDGDPVRPEAFARFGDSFSETVGAESQIREAMVAAIKGGEGQGQRMFVEAGDLADIASRHAREIAGREAGAAVTQGGQGRRGATAESAHDGTVRDVERKHVRRVYQMASVRVMRAGRGPTKKNAKTRPVTTPIATVSPIIRSKGVWQV